ncbi:hypothetical protein F5888DRAFT_1640086 [Russula emetica]|nr:hypothetical protein F5888DRAFT_1640086 [Russula emetica]
MGTFGSGFRPVQNRFNITPGPENREPDYRSGPGQSPDLNPKIGPVRSKSSPNHGSEPDHSITTSETIGSSCSCKCNGPIRGHQQHLAHSRASAARPKNIMGPSETIGSSCSCKCNGPIQGHRQHIPKKNNGPKQSHQQLQLQSTSQKTFWAQAKPSATTAAKLMGPFKGIGSTSPKNNNGPNTSQKELMGPSKTIGNYSYKCNGPIRGHQQHIPKQIMGPSKTIGSYCCKCNGPIRGHRQHLRKT